MSEENKPPPRRSREEMKASIKALLKQIPLEERKIVLKIMEERAKKIMEKVKK